ncbi:MAG: enolase C-terminal domain-like protein [Bacteroidota bacterium]
MPDLRISASALHIPLKTSFKQASSVRDTGESTWVVARRGDVEGYGEGCPRPYVTGETVTGALVWAKQQLASLQKQVTDVTSLFSWMEERRAEIDRNPAAFCALETALLDLFAQERGQSIEALLGLSEPEGVYQYTAVVGDGDARKFSGLIQRYLEWGFTDFKLKVNGDLAKDQQKLSSLVEAANARGLPNIRVRLDANNLWAGQETVAITYLKQLSGPFLGIEEPIAPLKAAALSRISTTLNQAIILDESLCTRQNLLEYDALPGLFIANLKVSRLGGVLRSLELVKLLRERNWPIIVGAHVGETSVLTRAGMLVARAAADQLLAQEGAFGTILLDYDPLSPSLRFGAAGRLDLREYKFNKTTGWGLTLVDPPD